MSRNIAVLGSTGSIGRQTLDVVRHFRDEIHVDVLAARENAGLLAAQAREFSPRYAVLTEASGRQEDFGKAELFQGPHAMARVAEMADIDLVVVGTAGAAGLVPTLAALQAGKRVALANKETLVMAGPVIKKQLEQGHGQLVPIDSEHSAIWQCLQGEDGTAVEKLTLTASGGALRSLDIAELPNVTPEQALRHPTWSMGKKITVDSANLMNKGLEILEARWLFDIGLDRVGVVLHEQSIVHSLVTFADGSVKAQLGLPDMRLPIQYALSHPMRWPNELPRLHLDHIGALTFGAIDYERYPAVDLAVRAGQAGGTYPAALCAADEVAVDAFLDHRIRFTDIVPVVRAVLDAHDHCQDPKLDDILETDRWARDRAQKAVRS